MVAVNFEPRTLLPYHLRVVLQCYVTITINGLQDYACLQHNMVLDSQTVVLHRQPVHHQTLSQFFGSFMSSISVVRTASSSVHGMYL